MPTIRVTVPKGAWTTDEKGVIAKSLTESLTAVAEEAGKGDIRAYVNVHVEETAEGGYVIGGNVIA